MSAKHGFTLVELMIVVSLLGILAALVVPQFGSSADEARTSALSSDLTAIRKQIELYRNHHEGRAPAFVGETGDDFIRRMTTKTDAAGVAGGNFGPYFLQMPPNPYNKLSTVRVGDTAPGAGTHGWRFNPVTGDFRADDDIDKNADGVADHIDL